MSYSDKYKIPAGILRTLYDSVYSDLRAKYKNNFNPKFFVELNGLFKYRVERTAKNQVHGDYYRYRVPVEAMQVTKETLPNVKQFVLNSTEFKFVETSNKFYWFYDEYVGWSEFKFGDYITKVNGTLIARTADEFNDMFIKLENANDGD